MSFFALIRAFFNAIFLSREYKSAMNDLRTASTHVEAIESWMAAFRHGDYEGALVIAEGLKDANPKAQYHFFRGGALTHLDRFEEAEKELRKAAIDDPDRSALAYSQLAQALLLQRRWEEAIDCSKKSSELDSLRGTPMRDIAEAFLVQGQVQESLNWAHRAVAADRRQIQMAASPEAQEAYELNLSEDLATLAWAVAAASKDRAQVDRLAEEAVQMAGNSVASTTSLVRLMVGHAYVAIDDTSTAVHHFEQGARVDPNGAFGRAAQGLAAPRAH